jgi:hypothetical protein
MYQARCANPWCQRPIVLPFEPRYPKLCDNCYTRPLIPLSDQRAAVLQVGEHGITIRTMIGPVE